ncbi:MAG: polyketide cyclase [Burkholderiales bacterium PBB5]|nr:MAG: polyketide cyclase [Burkholderiales bacterium PBB5]
MPDTPLHELVLSRRVAHPPMAVYRAWTEPALMKQWFTPRPWTTPVIETDVRPGGASYLLMRGPDGQEMPNRGVYLAVEPGRRLVFTDAFTEAWRPSDKAFMLAELSFEPLDEGRATQYTARVRHWSEADRLQHEQMGFHAGWGAATDQLEALLAGRPVDGVAG